MKNEDMNCLYCTYHEHGRMICTLVNNGDCDTRYKECFELLADDELAKCKKQYELNSKKKFDISAASAHLIPFVFMTGLLMIIIPNVIFKFNNPQWSTIHLALKSLHELKLIVSDVCGVCLLIVAMCISKL